MLWKTGNGIIWEGTVKINGESGLLLCGKIPLAVLLAERFCECSEAEDELEQVRITVENLESRGW